MRPMFQMAKERGLTNGVEVGVAFGANAVDEWAAANSLELITRPGEGTADWIVLKP